MKLDDAMSIATQIGVGAAPVVIAVPWLAWVELTVRVLVGVITVVFYSVLIWYWVSKKKREDKWGDNENGV